MNVQHAFTVNEVPMTDGGLLWEVVTSDGLRIASCTDIDAAEELEQILNIALTEWAEEDESDRVVNVV